MAPPARASGGSGAPANCPKSSRQCPVTAARPPVVGRQIGLDPPRSPQMAEMPRENIDRNAELHGFEPLRIVLAIGGLLLGLLMAIH